MVDKKIEYLASIRSLLAILVIVAHQALIYGAYGGWYVKINARPDSVTFGTLSLLLLIIKAFVLPFFFLLGGYFTHIYHHSEKSDRARYALSRVRRLLIPVILYITLVAPTLSCIRVLSGGRSIDIGAHLLNYFTHLSGMEAGPMWFLELLFVFNLLYLVFSWKSAFLDNSKKYLQKFHHRQLFYFLLSTAVATIIFRMILGGPVMFRPLALRLPDLPGFLAFYGLGLYLRETSWLDWPKRRVVMNWLKAGLFFMFAISPVIFILSAYYRVPLVKFEAGFNLYAPTYVVVELVISISLILASLFFFKLNKPVFKWTSFFNDQAYVAFFIHPLVITLFALWLKDFNIYPLLGFFMTTPVVVVLSFGLGWLIRRIPVLRKIF